MLDPSTELSQDPKESLLPISARAMISWIIGCAIGLAYQVPAYIILLPSAILLCLAFKWQWIPDQVKWMMLLCVSVLIAASWSTHQIQTQNQNTVQDLIEQKPKLITLQGFVATPIKQHTPPTGYFAAYNYRLPSSSFYLDVTHAINQTTKMRFSGQIRVKLAAPEHSIVVGAKILVTGWLSGFPDAKNPGELSYKKFAKRKGIYGQIYLANQKNWQLIHPPQGMQRLAKWRYDLARKMQKIFELGMNKNTKDTRANALIQALVLGKHQAEYSDVQKDFRSIGLAHLLSISGAHVGILIMFLLFIARLLPLSYRGTLIFTLIFLLAYLLVTPGRISVIRAGAMGVFWILGLLSGRKIKPINAVIFVAMIMITYDPNMLLDVGFQLSFGIVIMLILYTQKLSQWIWPIVCFDTTDALPRQWKMKFVANLIASNIVAWLASIPLIGLHFQEFHPLSIIFMTLGILPFVGLLCLGYVKLLLGIVWPSVSYLLSYIIIPVANLFLEMITFFEKTPLGKAYFSISIILVLGFLACIFYVLRNKLFSLKRTTRLILMITCCALAWIIIPAASAIEEAYEKSSSKPVSMFAFSVGEGSCYLFKDGEKILMYDAGTQGFLTLGRKVIVPALHKLRVKKIDTFILSHADIDHYVGLLDIADEFEIQKMILTQQSLDIAKKRHGSAIQLLLKELKKRKIKIITVSQGHTLTFANNKVKVLWPPRTFTPKNTNDTSIVLSLEIQNKKILMTGDLGPAAISKIINQPINADILEMPHHGSYNLAAKKLIEKLKPAVLIQSCSNKRISNDPWQTFFLNHPKIKRYITAKQGAIKIDLSNSKKIHPIPFSQGWQ